MKDVSGTAIEALRERPRWWLVPALAIFCAALPSFAQSDPQSKSAPAALVNPLIGTANSGNTFPGAVLPFGMVAFSPEERF